MDMESNNKNTQTGNGIIEFNSYQNKNTFS